MARLPTLRSRRVPSLLEEIERIVEDAAERAAQKAVEAVLARFPPEPALLDREGLARALRVPLAKVDKIIAEGCPSLLVVDEYRYDFDEVVPWLRAFEHAGYARMLASVKRKPGPHRL